MEQRERQATLLKYLLYFGIALLCFVLGEIPGFDPLWAKPIPVIAVVVAVSMLEGEIPGGVMGFVAGLMIDTYAYHIFGLASATFAVLGFACGTLVIYLLQDNMRTAFILTAVCSFIYGVMSYYVIYAMWETESGFYLFLGRTIPMIAVTTLFAFPIYHLIKRIKASFGGGDR